MKKKEYYKHQQGFTLVEIAVVLMIIGLLIGGILRGQELMSNVRIASTIKQIISYNGAIATFVSTYGTLPGDLRSATTRIPDCTAANSCVDGNGNKRIGEPISFWLGGQHGISTENTQFWKHLSLSSIITGVVGSAATPEWGRSHPVAPVNGGYSVITASGGVGPGGSFPTGTMVLRLHSCLTCANVEQQNGVNGSPVSPKHAFQIDRKMDDGIPFSGDVRAKAMGNGAIVADCEVAYRESREDPFCVMAFVINR